MDNQINLGEYIRTRQGDIGKLLEFDKDDDFFGTIDSWFKFGLPIKEKDIVNHNSDIKELIQTGDYINGIKVEEFDDEEGNMYLGFPIYDDALMDCIVEVRPINTIEIISIVTREQFSKISYNLEKKEK